MGPEQFHSKIFCPRLQIAFQFYGQTITNNIVFQQITFFLSDINHLGLTLTVKLAHQNKLLLFSSGQSLIPETDIPPLHQCVKR